MRSYRLCIADLVWGARGSPRLRVLIRKSNHAAGTSRTLTPFGWPEHYRLPVQGQKLIRRVGADGYKYGRNIYTRRARGSPRLRAYLQQKDLISLERLAPKQINESCCYNAIVQHDGAVGYSF